MPRTNLPPFYENLRCACAFLQLRSSEPRENYLRRRLCRSPRWIDGHLALASLTARRLLRAPEQAGRRALSTVRISATAAVRLLEAAHSMAEVDRSALPQEPGIRGARRYEAELWLACHDFLQRDYRAALTRFERVLADEHAVQLRREEHYLALEYGAAAASILGDGTKASELISRIPERFRPPDLMTMNRALTREQDEERR